MSSCGLLDGVGARRRAGRCGRRGGSGRAGAGRRTRRSTPPGASTTAASTIAGSGRLATMRRAMDGNLLLAARSGGAQPSRRQTSSRARVGRGHDEHRRRPARGRRRRARSRAGASPRSAVRAASKAAPPARRATTSRRWSASSRTKAMVSSSTCAQRRPPRRSAPYERRRRARSEYVASVVGVPLVAAVPRHRAARVLAVDALEADLVAGEDHRHAGHRELQAGRHPVHLAATRPGCGSGRSRGSRGCSTTGRSPASRTAACQARNVCDDRPAGPAGHRHRPAEGARRRGRVAQPRPHRPGEAGVVHRAVPAVAVEVAGGVVVVLADDERVVAELGSAVRRTARATSWATSRAPSRPVMLATSMRQPSTSYGGRSQRADHGVRALDHRGPQVGVAVVELGQRGVAHPARVGAVGLEVVVGPRRGRPGRRPPA